MLECSNCREFSSPGQYCEHCGHELEAQETVQEPDKEALTEVSKKVPAQSKAAEARFSGSDLQDMPKFVAENDCPDFQLEYNVARFFIANLMSSFAFRLRSKSANSKKCKNIKIEVRLNHFGGEKLKRSIWGVSGSSTPVNVNFRPTYEGFEIDSDVLISYTIDGNPKSFGGSFIWDCAQANTSASKVIENLTINLKDIHAGHAADQNLKLLENFNPQGEESPIERLQALKLKPVWKPVPLFSTDELKQVSLLQTVEKTHTGPVTLLSQQNTRIHFLPPGSYILGRGKGKNFIRTCYFDETGAPDLYRARGVSRYHATISCQPTGFFISDGGIGQDGLNHPSSNGTYIEGERLDHGKTQALEWKSHLEIALASPDSESVNCFLFQASAHPDPNSGFGDKLGGGLILRRVDGAKEIFIILAGTISSSVIPEIGTKCQLKHITGKFFLEQMDKRYSLIPGQNLDFGNRSWSCIPFQQHGLS